MRKKAGYQINTEGEEDYDWEMRDMVISPCSYKENYSGPRQVVQKVEVPWRCYSADSPTTSLPRTAIHLQGLLHIFFTIAQFSSRLSLPFCLPSFFLMDLVHSHR